MLKIERRGGSVSVAPNEIGWIVCVFAGGMAWAGVKLLIDQWPGAGRLHGMDVIGVSFILLWIGFVLWMGFKAYEYAKTELVLCDEGIILAGPRHTTKMKWEDIQDYGLHYLGKSRGRSLYELYFADKPQPQKNGQTRRLGKNVIRVHVSGGEEYAQIMAEILPYCKERTDVEPFLAGRFCI